MRHALAQHNCVQTQQQPTIWPQTSTTQCQIHVPNSHCKPLAAVQASGVVSWHTSSKASTASLHIHVYNSSHVCAQLHDSQHVQPTSTATALLLSAVLHARATLLLVGALPSPCSHALGTPAHAPSAGISAACSRQKHMHTQAVWHSSSACCMCCRMLPSASTSYVPTSICPELCSCRTLLQAVPAGCSCKLFLQAVPAERSCRLFLQAAVYGMVRLLTKLRASHKDLAVEQVRCCFLAVRFIRVGHVPCALKTPQQLALAAKTACRTSVPYKQEWQRCLWLTSAG